MENRVYNAPVILLADDDEDDLYFLKEALLEVHPDAVVHAANNGKETITYLENNAHGQLPDLLVLDYNMPIMNGYEVLNTLSSYEKYKSLKVCVWSTSRNHHEVEACLEKGALMYFVKPDNNAEFKNIAKTILAI